MQKRHVCKLAVSLEHHSYRIRFGRQWEKDEFLGRVECRVTVRRLSVLVSTVSTLDIMWKLVCGQVITQEPQVKPGQRLHTATLASETC